ncbi:hypothetical protein ACQP1P_22195 [Dactylosporangium sp. CA-052675]|uniref:hypothetical protein n=1 Tax=Dactylosporangium sp. CA-052675 TaxID=3239927 RepID=UPI003D92A070
MRRLLAVVLAGALTLAGCGASGNQPVAAQAPTSVDASPSVASSPSASPSLPAQPKTPGELRSLALPQASFQPSLGFALTYDRETSNNAIAGCNGRKLTRADLTMRQREWGDGNVEGEGGIAVVITDADLLVNGSVPAGTGPAGALAAAAISDRQACGKEHHADGSTVEPVPDWSGISLPRTGRLAKLNLNTSFCTKTSHAGHPDSYSCFIIAGIGSVYVQIYGFSDHDVQQAGSRMSDLLAAEAPLFDALPI